MASLRQLGTVGRISLKRFASFLQRESWKIEKSLARARFLSSAVGNGVTSSPLPEFEGVPGINNHQDLYRYSLENSDEFWSKLARSRLEWFKDFDQVSRCDMTTGSFEWFLNGKMNVTGDLLCYSVLLKCLILSLGRQCIGLIFETRPIYSALVT